MMTNMPSVKVYTDSQLRAELPDGIGKHIQDALSFANPERISAKREKIPGWQKLPAKILLWEKQDGIYYLPRGFAHNLSDGLSQLGYEADWQDNRASVETNAFEIARTIDLRSHQGAAVEALLKSHQGIYEAPPGSGKTVTALEAIRRAGQRALVIVDKTNIADQWRERARQYLGITTGFIGDGQWDEQDLTIGMKQTLYRHHSEEFFERWGLVCLDECHHAPAETYKLLLQSFPAKYRIGLSATPDKQNGPIAEAIFGPIFHRTTREELQGTGYIVRPTIRLITTQFTYKFKPTRTYRGTVVRNNYQRMMAALVSDRRRNQLIADRIHEEWGHHQLVVSRRLAHLVILHDLCKERFPSTQLFMLTGKENREERQFVSKAVEKLDQCVIFSTLADEALDIPRLDRLHLAWPQRQPGLIRQQVGRIERAFPGKTDALVLDYVDQVGVLQNQAKTRHKDVYRKERFPVKTSY